MMNKKTVLLVYLSFLAVFTMNATAQPSPGPEASLGPAHSFYSPSIWGSKVVWRYHDYATNLWKIMLGELETASTTVISEGTGNKYGALIQGDKIVWVDTRNGDPMNSNPDIYMYDIKKDEETRVTTTDDLLTWEQYPGVSGDYVVWMSLIHNAHMDGIWLRNIKTRSEPIKISGIDYTWYPVIYGDRVVYTDVLNIYVYTISQKKEEKLNIQPGYRFYFMDIWEDKIVWSELSSFTTYNGKSVPLFSIRMYDFSRPGSGSTIAENLYFLPHPRISKNKIVWSAIPAPDSINADIYMYDLGMDGIKSNDDSVVVITADPWRQVYPDIYEGCIEGETVSAVVWIDQRNFPELDGAELYWRKVFQPPFISDLDGYIQSLPKECFKNGNEGYKDQFHKKLLTVEADINQCMYQAALNKLENDVADKVDKWITCAEAQAELHEMILDLLDYLE